MNFIKKKYIRNLEKYLSSELIGKKLTFIINTNQFDTDYLSKIGFKTPISEGQSVLPSVVGSVSRFNADGKEIPLKDEEREICYRDFEFTRKEWHGREQVDVTDSVWIPYERYPRLFVEPPSIELTIIKNKAGELLIKTPPLTYNESSKKDILHCINLILELFGECHVFEEDNNDFVITPITKLHWEILPKGELPWDVLKQAIRNNRRKQADKSFNASLDRFKEINSLKPDFHATGSGGYQGYVIFGFTDKNLYVFESQFANNATYIFDKDWKELSKLTKAEILAGNLHTERLIHSPKWSQSIKQVINKGDSNYGY